VVVPAVVLCAAGAFDAVPVACAIACAAHKIIPNPNTHPHPIVSFLMLGILTFQGKSYKHKRHHLPRKDNMLRSPYDLVAEAMLLI
jgi:hypothetical protein